jgi:thymidylate synthase (FAD)
VITVIEPSYYWPETTEQAFPYVLEHVERCGRVCYKSEDRITPTSAARFVETICRDRHESVLEHVSLTAIIVCSRSCSHQLVRHRIAAYSQESQRYCNYNKASSLLVICPPSIGLAPGDYESYGTMIRQGGVTIDLNTRQTQWIHHIDWAYGEYKREVADGIKPEDARYILPNATKTELAVTYNCRQWLHVLKERALNKHAQWEIKGTMRSILDDLSARLKPIFGGLVGGLE